MTFAWPQSRILIGLAVATAGTFWLYLHSSDPGQALNDTTRTPDFYISQPHWI